MYEYVTSLRKDGKPRKRLELVYKKRPIGEFHRRYYQPMLRKMKYHKATFCMAKHCRDMRRSAIMVGEGLFHRDFGERLPVE